MDCIFCKIAQGTLPSTTLYETDRVRVILDISPASEGHALVLPKAHYSSLLECSDQDLGAVFEAVQKVAQAMEKELHCDGINVLVNCREAAGQTVDHFHVHLIPRYSDAPQKDHLLISSTPIESPDFEALAETIQKSL